MQIRNKLRRNWTKLVLDWRHCKGNVLMKLSNMHACLRCHQKMHQNCWVYICIEHLLWHDFRLPLLVRSLLFWDVIQYWYVVSYRHFGPAYEFQQVLDPWR